MHPAPDDPYRTPVHPADPAMPVEGQVFRDGRHLIVRSGAVLLGFCPLTGEALDGLPAQAVKRKTLAFTWMPTWTYLALIPAIVPFMILMLTTRRKGSLTLTLGPRGLRRSRIWKGVVVLLFAGAVLCGGIAMAGTTAYLHGKRSDEPGSWLLAMVLLAFASLLVFATKPSITIAGYRGEGWLKIAGCSPHFLDRLPPVSFGSLR